MNGDIEIKKPQFQYTNYDATAIAVSPNWTPITGPSFFPVRVLVIQTSSLASFEISFDGVNPIALVNPESNLGGLINIPYQIDFYPNSLELPKETTLYARIVMGTPGVGERFTATFIG